jgi:hypothetical protein
MVFSFETNWTPWSLAPLQFIKKNGGEFIKCDPAWGTSSPIAPYISFYEEEEEE